ncbi:MAG TPA: hypothetical protein VEH27_12110 [Methylomirabilota bacterium]|nr:hypothetical protein [Methylomirabilota bacterium]
MTDLLMEHEIEQLEAKIEATRREIAADSTRIAAAEQLRETLLAEQTRLNAQIATLESEVEQARVRADKAVAARLVEHGIRTDRGILA